MKPDDMSILITGASTGIGKATALHLDGLGFKVYAGVRKDADGMALRKMASARLIPIRLDVTDLESIAEAAAKAEQECDGKLHGLINNAGVSLSGPLEMTPFPEIETVMSVNVIGALAVTKTFIPLLRKGNGRLINISSGHGLLAVPDKSVYAASKFAVEAITDSLRVELKPFGISVTSIIVGKVDTAVLGKIEAGREAMIRESDPEVANLYAPLLEFFDREVKTIPGVPPIEVGRVVAEVLMVRRPKARYMVGPGARKMQNLARLPRAMREGMMYRTIYGESGK